MRTIFIGPNGVRAGWRMLLFIILFALFESLVPLIARAIHLPRTAGGAPLLPGSTLVVEVMQILITLLATWIMAKGIDHQKWSAYGLPWAIALRSLFWCGTVVGLFALSLQLCAMRLLHVFYFGHTDLNAFAALHYGAVWLLVFFSVALSEELLFRGYLLRTLTDGMGFWPAAVITSLIFAWLHIGNTGENILGIIAVFAVGMFFCLTVRRTGNLWWAVGFHTGWDWAESYLYGVPDSGTVAQGHLLSPVITGSHWLTGGSAGPEGSVLIFVTLSIAALIFSRVYPEVKYTRRALPQQEPPIAEATA